MSDENRLPFSPDEYAGRRERAVELVADGAIPVDGLITRVVPLTEVESAFEALEAGQAMKILVGVSR